MPQSSSNVSSGSPVGRGRSSSGSRGPSTFAGPSASPEGDGKSFNPSDYSGEENNIHQAVAVPFVASGRAERVQVRPSRMINTVASANESDVGTTVASGKSQMTDQEAEALGAQDADRYIANAQIGSAAANTYDPFVDAAFQSLIAKPANEMSAGEMARIKEARETGDMGGGVVDWMNALHAKSDAEPGEGNTEGATSNTRTKTGENFLSRVRGLGKKSKGKSRKRAMRMWSARLRPTRSVVSARKRRCMKCSRPRWPRETQRMGVSAEGCQVSTMDRPHRAPLLGQASPQMRNVLMPVPFAACRRTGIRPPLVDTSRDILRSNWSIFR